MTEYGKPRNIAKRLDEGGYNPRALTTLEEHPGFQEMDPELDDPYRAFFHPGEDILVVALEHERDFYVERDVRREREHDRLGDVGLERRTTYTLDAEDPNPFGFLGPISEVLTGSGFKYEERDEERERTTYSRDDGTRVHLYSDRIEVVDRDSREMPALESLEEINLEDIALEPVGVEVERSGD